MLAVQSKEIEKVEYLLQKGANVHHHEKGTGNTPLFIAIQFASIDIMELLISSGANLEEQNNNGGTPLFLAVQMKEIEKVEYLLQKGANVHHHEKERGNTPLFTAIQFASIDIMELLISSGANLEEQNNNGGTPLFLAVQMKEIEKVEYLLQKGANVHHHETERGNTPLFYAIQFASIDIMELLISSGANLEEQNNNGATPLFLAVERKEIETVEYLLQKGANVHHQEKQRGNTPLFIAIQFSSIEIMELLLSSGANLEEQNNNGATPLFLAVQRKEIEKVEYLLQKGANVHHKDDEQVTPLWLAALKGSVEIVEILLNEGARLEDQDADGRTPLFLAVRSISRETVEYTLQKGANVHHHEKELGNTPLFNAIQFASIEIMELLLSSGANLEEQNNNGATPLFFAVAMKEIEKVEYLLQKGANVHHRDYDQKTPLISAAFTGSVEIVKSLLENGAKVNATMEPGHTALIIASQQKHTEIVQLLLKHDADVTIKDRSGWTALFWAVHNEHIEEIKCLVKNEKYNPNDTDMWGNTIFHHYFYRARELNPGFIDFLLTLGVDEMIKNHQGLNWIHFTPDEDKFQGFLKDTSDISVLLKESVLRYFFQNKKGNSNMHPGKLLLATGRFDHLSPLQRRILNGVEPDPNELVNEEELESVTQDGFNMMRLAIVSRSTGWIKLLSTKKPSWNTSPLLGKYYIEKYMGGGGYGLVLQGRHLDDERQKYAIKIVNYHCHLYDMKNALPEVTNLMKVNREQNDGITGVIDVWFCESMKDMYQSFAGIEPEAKKSTEHADWKETDAFIAIVMELLDMNFESWLEENQKDVPKFALGFLFDILRGIKKLHTEVLHRDLKPENFLVRLNPILRPEVILTDLGLSGEKIPNKPFDYGNSVYRAPEGTLDEKSEIFAIGMIFATLLDPEFCHFGPFCSKHERNIKYYDCSKYVQPMDEVKRGTISNEIQQKYPFEAGLFKRMTSQFPENRPTTDEALKLLREYGETWKEERDRHTRERKRFIQYLHL